MSLTAMTDPLSISVGILAIISATETVIDCLQDFIEAIEKRRVLQEKLETFSSLLKRLKAWCDDASSSQPDPDTPPSWLRGLWEVQPDSGHFDKNGVWVYRYKGSVAQFKQIIDEMSTRLIPSTKIKASAIYQRATWHWNKDAFTKIHADITECCTVMNTFFLLKSDETQKEVLDSVKYNTVQLSNIYSRLSESEINQKREDERRRLEEATKEREEITTWLSPLNFRGKQEKLWSTCLQETGDWLWQDQRFKVWAEGSPWYLVWFVFSP